MDHENLKQTIASYAARPLAQRKHWYSPAATNYNEARPSYPPALIEQVVEHAQLSPRSKLLEVGCGPATATVVFAELGLSMLCLEPNPDFYRLAQHNCQQYPNVEIQNSAFEEWPLEANGFDVVLAASSFHWIPADVGYPKAAQALKRNGHLVLLWNKELQPSYEVYQNLAEVYAIHAPDLNRYEDRATQEKILSGLGQLILDSELFQDLVAGQVITEVTYTTDQYLTLLQTYSNST
jgi:SAM-dependent methyltransferase